MIAKLSQWHRPPCGRTPSSRRPAGTLRRDLRLHGVVPDVGGDHRLDDGVLLDDPAVEPSLPSESSSMNPSPGRGGGGLSPPEAPLGYLNMMSSPDRFALRITLKVQNEPDDCVA